MSYNLKLVGTVSAYEYKLTPTQIAAASKAHVEPFGLVGHKLAHNIMRLNNANARFGEFDNIIYFWCTQDQTHGIADMIESMLGKAQ